MSHYLSFERDALEMALPKGLRPGDKLWLTGTLRVTAVRTTVDGDESFELHLDAITLDSHEEEDDA